MGSGIVRSLGLGLDPTKASDRQLLAEGMLDLVELPLGDGAEELQGDRVRAFAMDPSDGQVRPHLAGAGEADRERAGVRHPFPGVAPQRVHKMADGFHQPFVRGLGKRQPTARPNLPMVHSRETAGGESVQGHGGRAKEAFNLHDLLLSEDRLEAVKEWDSAASERFVDQVDLKTHVGPADALGRGTGPTVSRGSALRNTAGGRLSTGGAGSVRHCAPGSMTRPGVPT